MAGNKYTPDVYCQMRFNCALLQNLHYTYWCKEVLSVVHFKYFVLSMIAIVSMQLELFPFSLLYVIPLMHNRQTRLHILYVYNKLNIY